MKKYFNSENVTAVVVVIVALVIWQMVGSTVMGWVSSAKKTVAG
jgi:hypothetical protein